MTPLIVMIVVETPPPLLKKPQRSLGGSLKLNAIVLDMSMILKTKCNLQDQ